MRFHHFFWCLTPNLGGFPSSIFGTSWRPKLAWRGATTTHAISIMPPQSQIFLVACQSASVIPKAFLGLAALKMGYLRPIFIHQPIKWGNDEEMHQCGAWPSNRAIYTSSLLQLLVYWKVVTVVTVKYWIGQSIGIVRCSWWLKPQTQYCWADMSGGFLKKIFR